jgi:hypothetical protein
VERGKWSSAAPGAVRPVLVVIGTEGVALELQHGQGWWRWLLGQEAHQGVVEALPRRRVRLFATPITHTGAMAGIWGITPRRSVEAECARRGESAVVSGCVALLQGQEVDDALVLAIGGRHAEYVLGGGEGGRSGYWPRVWACRALLYAWEEPATTAVVLATGDEAWRVREMAAKVIARHRLEDAIGAVVGLQGDPVTRVRAAGERAVLAIYASART